MGLPDRSMALEHFLALPEDEPALEYVAGRVGQKGSPKGPRGGLQFELGYLMADFVRPDAN